MQQIDITAVIVAVIVGLIGSGGSGLLAFLISRRDHKTGAASKQSDMVRALGHDRIVYLGSKYIERGWITTGELDDFNTICDAYFALDGDGTGHTMYMRVKSLPVKDMDEIITTKKQEEAMK